jgi:hypothetical protein
MFVIYKYWKNSTSALISRNVTFSEDKIEYCGHIIDKHGLHKTQKNVEAVLNTPAPKTVTEVRAFLGLVIYYPKFLPNISTVV